ncbi:hypothetical protein HYS31_00250 [Candidatus Woesearchaeota archaeon]|nr:hypothetical protein [Candidatus Woesearchaeota archaeon]
MAQSRRDFLQNLGFGAIAVPLFAQDRAIKVIQIQYKEGWLLNGEGYKEYLRLTRPHDVKDYPTAEWNNVNDHSLWVRFRLPDDKLPDVAHLLVANHLLPDAKSQISALESLADNFSADDKFLESKFGICEPQDPPAAFTPFDDSAKFNYRADDLILGGRLFDVELQFVGRRTGRREITPVSINDITVKDSKTPDAKTLQSLRIHESGEDGEIITLGMPETFDEYYQRNPQREYNKTTNIEQIGNVEIEQKSWTQTQRELRNLQSQIIGRRAWWTIYEAHGSEYSQSDGRWGQQTTVPELRKILTDALKKQSALRFDGYWNPVTPGFVYSKK